MIPFLLFATALAASSPAPSPPPTDSSHVVKQPAPAKTKPAPVHAVRRVAPKPAPGSHAAAKPMSAWRKAYIARHGHAPGAPAKSAGLHRYRRCT